MRLLVVGVAWPPETFLARLFQGLMDAGIKVTIGCNCRPEPDWLTQPRFRWQPTPTWNQSIPSRLLLLAVQTWGAFIRDPVSTARHLRCSLQGGWRTGLVDWNRIAPFIGQRWDLIYFPWNSGAIAYLPLFDWGIPAVVSCRGRLVNVAPHNPEHAALRKGLRATFQRAAAVHCVSEAILAEALAFDLDPAKATVIRPAVNPDFFTPPASSCPPSSEFGVVTTGSLIWRKGYEYALQAIRLLVDRNVPVQFTIIGDGPERQRLLYTIYDLGLQKHVHLLGRLSPTQVLHHLQQADTFLLTSLSEGISNAVLEAMACGLPVVTSDCGGMREAVSDGVEGFVVPMRDPSATAAALLKLWQAEGKRVQMGVAARRRIVQDHRLDVQIGCFVQLFERVCSRKVATP
jgi:glycosyltransferase involved in cell wall biosynthesis